MKKFFEIGDKFAANSNWKDFALTKFCLFAMGIIVGCLLPASIKKTAITIAVIIFLITYVPLMIKTFKIMKKED